MLCNPPPTLLTMKIPNEHFPISEVKCPMTEMKFEALTTHTQSILLSWSNGSATLPAETQVTLVSSAIKRLTWLASFRTIFGYNLRTATAVVPALITAVLSAAEKVRLCKYFERDASRFWYFSHLGCFQITAATTNKL